MPSRWWKVVEEGGAGDERVGRAGGEARAFQAERVVLRRGSAPVNPLGGLVVRRELLRRGPAWSRTSGRWHRRRGSSEGRVWALELQLHHSSNVRLDTAVVRSGVVPASDLERAVARGGWLQSESLTFARPARLHCCRTSALRLASLHGQRIKRSLRSAIKGGHDEGSLGGVSAWSQAYIMCKKHAQDTAGDVTQWQSACFALLGALA